MGYYTLGRIPSVPGLEIIDMSRQRLPFDADYLRSAYLAGRDAMILAKEFKVSDATIRRRLKEAGIEIRSHGAAAILRSSQRTAEEQAAISAKIGRSQKKFWKNLTEK